MILCVSSFIGNEYIFLKWIYIFIGTWTTFLIFCKFRMILFLSLLPVLKVSFYINEVEHAFILTLCCRKGAGRVSWESEGEIPVISIALVIFSFKYRSDYQTMTGHNWNLLVSIEIPQFVIAGLADSSTNSLLSACVGEWGWEGRNLIACYLCFNTFLMWKPVLIFKLSSHRSANQKYVLVPLSTGI